MKHIRKTVFHYLVFTTRKTEVFKKRLRVDRNNYVCLSRNVLRVRGAQHTPMIDIFFCLEWLKVKPSALNLSQALLFRKSGNPNKQTKNESCPEMVARQHSRRQEQEKTSDRFCRRLAIKTI